MNDRRMGDLVRMAMEVEELEQGASGGAAAPRLRLVGSEAEHAHPQPTRAWWIGMSVGAAAVLAMAAALPLIMSGPVDVEPARTVVVKIDPVAPPVVEPTPTPAPQVIAQGSGALVQPVAMGVDAGSLERCVVVAIYRDNQGGLNCVSAPTPQVWQGNKCLSEVSAQEIKTLKLDCARSKETDHALVVAMSGPQRSLPKTESDAIGIATCILDGPNAGEGIGRMATAAASCVPPEVAVKIESVGAR